MEYDGHRPGSGWWNCPYPPEWVERMKRAAKVCEPLTAEQVEAALTRTVLHNIEPPGDILNEEQDERRLPLSWYREYEAWHEGLPDCCVATYDYDSIPEIVVTNGKDDWPLMVRGKILTS